MCTNYAPFLLTGIWLLNFLVVSIYTSQKVEIEVIDNSYMNLRYFLFLLNNIWVNLKLF